MDTITQESLLHLCPTSHPCGGGDRPFSAGGGTLRADECFMGERSQQWVMSELCVLGEKGWFRFKSLTAVLRTEVDRWVVGRMALSLGNLQGMLQAKPARNRVRDRMAPRAGSPRQATTVRWSHPSLQGSAEAGLGFMRPVGEALSPSAELGDPGLPAETPRVPAHPFQQDRNKIASILRRMWAVSTRYSQPSRSSAA